MSPPPEKRMVRRKQFCDSWLDDPSFAPWLARCKGDVYKAKCVACKKLLQAGKTELIKHSRTQLHLLMIDRMQTSSSSESEAENVPSTSSMNFQEKVKRAEILYVLDAIEHSRSFQAFNNFSSLTNKAGCDSTVLSRISLKRTKITAIIKNVINKSIIDKTIPILQQNVFSILVDESTDVSKQKNLCILARFMHEGKLQTYLFDYLRVADSTAEYWYQCFHHTLDKYQIPVQNVIGICTDNVMLGKQNSFVSRLMQDTKNELAVFPCICRSMHLVASHACDRLPKHVDGLLHLLSIYSSKSKRQYALKDIQKVMSMEKQKVLQPSKTKWLGIYEVVAKVMNQWNALYEFFTTEARQDKMYIVPNVVSSHATLIFEQMNCVYTKAYLYFINFTQKMFRHFNTVFQTNKIIIQVLMQECNVFLRLLASNFMKDEIVLKATLSEVDPFEPDNLLPLEDINIGQHARDIINPLKQSTDKETQEKIKQFYAHCLSFYQEAYRGTLTRLPFNEPFLKHMSFLLPEKTLKTKNNTDELSIILDKYPTKVYKQAAIDEWLQIPYSYLDEELEDMKKLTVCEFWERIKKTNNQTGGAKFPNIYRIAQICLSLPHSNAEIEKCFSQISEMKYRDRNRLKSETVAAIMRIKMELNSTQKTFDTYPITRGMLQLMNSDMYKKESIPQDLQNVILPDETDSSGSDMECNREIEQDLI